MNKFFTLLFCVFLMSGIQVQGQDFESATNAVKNMGVGWNLGNTLEASPDLTSNMTGPLRSFHDKSQGWGLNGMKSH